MRVFTIIGVVLTVVGVGLLVIACSPQSSGPAGMIGGMAAGIAAVTLLPMGIIFTLIGVWTQRLMGGRQQLITNGIPGQATILSVGGGNMYVNRINVLLTFRLRVTVPGRPAYEMDHRQLVSMFSMAALQIGASVPVMVDPADPNRLTIDFAGEGVAAAARQARPVSDFDADGASRQVQPNTLSTMGAVAPNTISTGTSGQGAQWVAPLPGQAGVDVGTAAAISAQLARMGISVDPTLISGGQLTMDVGTVDLRPDAVGTILANGLMGTAVIRTMTDTGVNVRGESLVRLSLDIRGAGGESYQVDTGSLVPDSARSRALPGATVPVRIDPSQPNNVVVDWAAGP